MIGEKIKLEVYAGNLARSRDFVMAAATVRQGVENLSWIEALEATLANLRSEVGLGSPPNGS